jgi:hypothetical protein
VNSIRHTYRSYLMTQRLGYVELVEISRQSKLEPLISNSTLQKPVAEPVFQERRRIDMFNRRSVTVKDGVAKTQWANRSRCLLSTSHLLVPWRLIQLQLYRS